MPRKDDDDDLDAGELGVVPQPPQKGRKPKPTMKDHLGHYQHLFGLLDAEIDRRRRERDKGTRAFRIVRKTLTQMRKEVPGVTKSKEARLLSSTRKTGNSGLTMPCCISDDLRAFLKLPVGARISRVDATRAVCVYAKLRKDEVRSATLRWAFLNPKSKRNLQDPEDRKTILLDETLKKLLRYDVYCKAVSKGLVTKKVRDRVSGVVTVTKITSPKIFYWSIQVLLKHHFLRDEELLTSDDSSSDEDS